MNTALVTGVAGFIGSHTAEALLGDGWNVIGVDAFTSSYDPSLKKANLRVLRSAPGFAFVHADLRTVDIRQLLANVDAVIHLAGRPAGSVRRHPHLVHHLHDDLLSTHRLLEAVVAAGVPRLVVGSCAEVATALDDPTIVIEGDTLPEDPIAAALIEIEALCTVYGATNGLSIAIARCFPTYGPRQRPDMALFRMINSAIAGHPFVTEDVSTRDDYIDVSEVADALRHAANVNFEGTVTFDVGCGRTRSQADLLLQIEMLTGAHIDVRERRNAPRPGSAGPADMDATERSVGWRSHDPFPDGLRRQIAWQQSLAPSTLTLS